MNIKVAWFWFDEEIRHLLHKNIYRYNVSSNNDLTLWEKDDVVAASYTADEWHHFDVIKEGSTSTVYPKLGGNN